MKRDQKCNNQYNFTHNHQNFASALKKYKYNLNLGDITAGTIFSEEQTGFLVDIGAPIAAYLPIDEITINKYQPTKPRINETREFFILAHDRKSKQLILSIKRFEYIKAWQRIKQMQKEDIVIELDINKVNKGGILTSIEGIQAFIPNSHSTGAYSKESLINKRISCQFLIVDEKNNKIIFSHKRAILKHLNAIIHVGQITSGEVIKITTYGIFIEIYGIPALLHISEISNKKIKTNHMFSIGETITIQIIHIDKQQGRLSVSKRRLD